MPTQIEVIKSKTFIEAIPNGYRLRSLYMDIDITLDGKIAADNIYPATMIWHLEKLSGSIWNEVPITSLKLTAGENYVLREGTLEDGGSFNIKYGLPDNGPLKYTLSLTPATNGRYRLWFEMSGLFLEETNADLPHSKPNAKAASFRLEPRRRGSLTFDTNDVAVALAQDEEFLDNEGRYNWRVNLGDLNANTTYTVDPTAVLTDAGTGPSAQRKTAFLQGRFWVFYQGNVSPNDIKYKSSIDGVNWSAASVALAEANAIWWGFDVYLKGSDVAIVAQELTNNHVHFRKGTLNTDGTITWSDTVLVYDGGTYDAELHAVAKAADGTWWVAIGVDAGTADYDYKIYSSSNGTDWTCQLTEHHSAGNFHGRYTVTHILPKASGSQVYFLVAEYFTTKFFWWYWSGSSMSSRSDHTPSNTMATYTLKDDRFSAVIDSNNLMHLVWQTSGNAVYYKNFDGSTWSSETQIDTSTCSYPTIGVRSDDHLDVVWIKSSLIYHRLYDGSWQSIDQPFGATFTGPVYTNQSRTAADNVSAVWREGTGSPYSLMHDFICFGSFTRTVTDSSTSVTETPTLGIPISETGAGTDTPALEGQTTSIESGTGSEVNLIVAFPSIIDVGTGVDIWTKEVIVAENGWMWLEYVSFNKGIADAGSGTELVVTYCVFFPTDSATGTDTRSVTASLGYADVGAGVDAPTISMTVTITDSMTGVDVRLIEGQISYTDSGALLSEIITITLVDVAVFDTGAFVDVWDTTTAYQLGSETGILIVEVAWRLKGSVIIDDINLPHVIAVDVSDPGEVAEKKILTVEESYLAALWDWLRWDHFRWDADEDYMGELPRHVVVGKRGREVNIEGWSNSQDEIEALRDLDDGERHAFVHPDGSCFAVIVPVVDVSRDADRLNRRRYRLTLLETV